MAKWAPSAHFSCACKRHCFVVLPISLAKYPRNHSCAGSLCERSCQNMDISKPGISTGGSTTRYLSLSATSREGSIATFQK
ncbi:hypothetical protein EUZ85_18850 [Hahella sp. KA22]|nr:hypothetical protein ENC22_16275 [Hahella sp. KA22]QAY56045.1 hypothetical protein EUZ85_18850 [Hahella sp. KA22]